MEDRIRHFLRFLSLEGGVAENTVDAYRTDLLQFCTGLSPLGLNGGSTDWRRISRDVIVSYVSELKERRYAEATVARKVAAMKSFFQYLHAEGIIRRNPTESLESPRVGKTLPRPLTVQQVDELLEQPAKRNTTEALRDQAMLELLYA
ncbi:MAG: site-specific integrase, partial [Planctomycetes bacterium]|nr:site-specific integrase [Planctomycetota bacterium]